MTDRGHAAQPLEPDCVDQLHGDALMAVLHALSKTAQVMRTELRMRNRLYHFRTYKQCFSGTEATAFFVRKGLAPDEEQGVALGRLLMRFGFIRHVVKPNKEFVASNAPFQLNSMMEPGSDHCAGSGTVNPLMGFAGAAAGRTPSPASDASRRSSAFDPVAAVRKSLAPLLANSLFRASLSLTDAGEEDAGDSACRPASTPVDAPVPPPTVSTRHGSGGLLARATHVAARWRGDLAGNPDSPPAAHADMEGAAAITSTSHSSSGSSNGSSSSSSSVHINGAAGAGDSDGAAAGASAAAAERDAEAEATVVPEPVPELAQGERWEGYLDKRGTNVFTSDWRRRWVVLSGSVLAYFEAEDEAAALGYVDLGAPGVRLAYGAPLLERLRKRLLFEIVTVRRSYVFQASDVADLQEWLARLAAQLAAAQRQRVSAQMHVCRRLLAALMRDGFLQRESEDALTVALPRGSKRADPLQRLEVREVLGQGNFGKVKLVVDKRDGREYAMKIIPRPTKDVERQMKVIRSEIEALERVKRFGGHENIIALHEVFENAEAVFIVMELATGGELMEAIAEKKTFTEDEARDCMRHITQAVQFAHEHGIVHRDLKPENVQLTAEGVLKLLDFGFAKCLPLVPTAGGDAAAGGVQPPDVHGPDAQSRLMNTFLGTRYAAAPEIWNHEPYTMAVDSWGLGVVLYMLLLGQQPFSDFGGMGELASRVTKARYRTPQPQWGALSEQARDLIGRLVVVDPQQRLTAAQILRHDWFVRPSPALAPALAATVSSMRRYSTAKRLQAGEQPAELAALSLAEGSGEAAAAQAAATSAAAEETTGAAEFRPAAAAARALA